MHWWGIQEGGYELVGDICFSLKNISSFVLLKVQSFGLCHRRLKISSNFDVKPDYSRERFISFTVVFYYVLSVTFQGRCGVNE